MTDIQQHAAGEAGLNPSVSGAAGSTKKTGTGGTGANPVSIRNIGHVSFNTKNMPEMLHFYCEILGMRKLFTLTYGDLWDRMKESYGDSFSEKAPDWVKDMGARKDEPWIQYLKLADRQYLELFYDDGREKEDWLKRRDSGGYIEVEYEVADLDALQSWLLAHQVIPLMDIYTTSEGALALAVEDPDGNRLQFIQYLPEALTRLGMPALSPEVPGEGPLRYTTKVSYQVRNKKEMKRFYEEGLGLKNVLILSYESLLKIVEEDGEVDMDSEMVLKIKAKKDLPWVDYLEVAPHQYLALFDSGGGAAKDAEDLSRYYGYQHLCLEVSDIHKAWEAVVAGGLTPEGPISQGADGSWQFWLVDPDGNRLELMGYGPDSKQLL